MTYDTQYPQQAFIDPETLGEPEAVKLEEFWQPFSTPLRVLALTAALLASSGTIPTDLEQEAAAADETTEWYQPLSEPVLRSQGETYRATLTASGATPIDPETLGEVLADKLEWYTNLSSPVRLISRYQHPALFDDQELIGAEGGPLDTSSEWWQDLSIPVPPVIGLQVAYQQAFVIDPETLGEPEDTALSWYMPLSEPLPPPLAVGELVYVEHIEPLLDTSLEDWLQPLSEPTPSVVGLHVSLQQAFTIDPLALDAEESTEFIEWFMPLSEPVLPISRYQHVFDFPDPVVFGVVGVLFTADSRITTPASADRIFTTAAPDRTFTSSSPSRTFTPADN